MGTCYGIVPYVDSENTGSVAGIVGAGGNTGAIILGILFMSHDYDVAMEYMGWFTVGMSLITPLIVIRGYKGILFGQDEHDDPNQKRSLMVPKMRHSPHLVKIRNKMQVNKRDPDYQGSEKA
jgi:nitrate/nitrite transporter NarK